MNRDEKISMENLTRRIEKSNVTMVQSSADVQRGSVKLLDKFSKDVIHQITLARNDIDSRLLEIDVYQRNFENRITEVLEQIHRATFFGGIGYAAERVSEKIKVLINRFVKK